MVSYYLNSRLQNRLKTNNTFGDIDAKKIVEFHTNCNNMQLTKEHAYPFIHRLVRQNTVYIRVLLLLYQCLI